MTLTDRLRPFVLLQGITGLTGGGATKIDGIPTVGLPVPFTAFCTIAGAVSFYELRAGTDAEASPDIIRPDDYTGGSNEKVWALLDLNTAAIVTGALMASANLSDLGNVATARTSLGLGTAALKNAGAANGVADLDGAGKVPSAQLPGGITGGLTYKGTWNAGTNSPNLDTIGPATGDYYVISAAGAHTLTGESDTDWQPKDWAVYNGTGWNKIDNTEQDATGSVNGNIRLAGVLNGTASSPGLAANSCTDSQIGNRTVDDTAASPSSTGSLTNLLSWICVIVKGITGKSSWLTAPRTTLENAVKLNGDSMTGDLTVAGKVTADKWANTQSTLAYAATTTIDMDGVSARTLTLAGNVTFATSNRAAGKMVKVKILVDGSDRTPTWPAWVPIGAAFPATLKANKVYILSLECWGGNEADVTAALGAQP